MPPSEPQDLVLRLLDGRSEQRELILRGGRERPPFAIGRESPWRVEARHVGAAHVMLAFNGATLYVCALHAQTALLDGEPLDKRWVEAAVPSVLQFGDARLAIARSARPTARTPLPRPRPSRDDEATCFDEVRLRAALMASIPNGEITCIAEVEIPEEARRPIARPPLALPDSARTLAAPPVAEAPGDPHDEGVASSMPTTIPSDDLLAIALPSIARIEGDSLAAVAGAALAVSGENASSQPSGDVRSPIPEPGTWRRLHDAWRRASPPKRALSILLGPAVVCALLTLRPAYAVPNAAPDAEIAAPHQALVPNAPVVTPAAAARKPPSAQGADVTPTGSQPKTSPVGLHETRTPERRALDTVASGLDDAAAAQYEALARAHPENVAFREAARILRERGSSGHRAQD